jgi:hypothetical protein
MMPINSKERTTTSQPAGVDEQVGQHADDQAHAGKLDVPSPFVR